jgi:hypothetical protein
MPARRRVTVSGIDTRSPPRGPRAATWLVPQLGSLSLRQVPTGHVRDLHATMKAAGRNDATIRQAGP